MWRVCVRKCEGVGAWYGGQQKAMERFAWRCNGKGSGREVEGGIKGVWVRKWEGGVRGSGDGSQS